MNDAHNNSYPTSTKASDAGAGSMPPPPGVSCSAPSNITPNGTTPVQITGYSPVNGPLTYFFLVSSGQISVNGVTTNLGQYTSNTSNGNNGVFTASYMQPGQFAWVFCQVEDAYGQYASTYKTINVIPGNPPTVACAAPQSVAQGQPATVTASGSSTSPGPLTYSFSASSGNVSASGNQATLDTSPSPPGPISVTCTATDQYSQSASSTTKLYVDSATGEQALTAFQFTDSVGVNIALHQSNTPYVYAFPQIKQLMTNLGIHHYRNSIDPYAYSFEYQNAETLAQAGLKADWIMGVYNGPSIVQSILQYAPDSVEAFEGPNEDGDIVPNLTNYVQTLYNEVRAVPQFANTPIYAPTVANLTDFPLLGNISPYVTNGNMHDYYNPRYPETPAYGGVFYGCGAYGTLSFDYCLAELPNPGLPIVSTETGFVSNPIPDAAIGRYIPRLLFMHLGNNVLRTYLYELADEPNSLNYGLVTNNLTPKPAYTAIQSFINLFQDASFSNPAKIQLSLGGNLANINHVTFQKSDGTFMIAIWQGVESAYWPTPVYNVPQTLLYPAPQTVTLTTNTPTGSATIYTIDDYGNITGQPGNTANSTTQVSVTDRITIVSLPRQ